MLGCPPALPVSHRSSVLARRLLAAADGNRVSHFYLALYWARELANQSDDEGLAARFAPLAERLAADEETIVKELSAVQGDVGGYSRPDLERAAAMRPSATLNDALATLES